MELRTKIYLGFILTHPTIPLCGQFCVEVGAEDTTHLREIGGMPRLFKDAFSIEAALAKAKAYIDGVHCHQTLRLCC
jgi:hypothetical protein